MLNLLDPGFRRNDLVGLLVLEIWIFVIWVLQFGALGLACPTSFWRGAWNFL
jgi:hypothetical protein